MLTRTILVSSFVVVLSLFAISCTVMPQEEITNNEAEANETVGKHLPMNLPCFGCHSHERFNNPDIFPHQLHKDMGLHCNQCHMIRSHMSMSLNGDTCKSCHKLTILKLSLTAMPAEFNHEAHTTMYDCSDCHKKTFKMKANSVKISMDSMYRGKYCGKCHNGKIAFASTDCSRCHRGT